MAGLEGPFCFHIGYHRTGTTFLQHFVLQQYPEIGDAFPPEPAARALKRYLLDEATSDTTDVTSRGGDLAWYLSRHDRRLLLSQEALSGDLYSDNHDMVDTIRRCCPDSTILVTLRSQYTLLPSLYQYLYIKSGGSQSYREYVRLAIGNDKCDYFSLVSRYADVFGKDSVRVLLYEDLRDHPTEFLKQFLDFVDLPLPGCLEGGTQHYNRRPSVLHARLGRLTNRLFADDSPVAAIVSGRRPGNMTRARHRAMRAVKAAAALGQRLGLTMKPFEDDPVGRDEIAQHYAANNRKLAALLNRDLAARGYPN